MADVRGVASTNMPVRKTIRLKGYDYSQAGLYFITICTQNRLRLFREIKNGEMILNDAGIMIDKRWNELKHKYMNIELHAQIINETNSVGADLRVCPDDTIMNNE